MTDREKLMWLIGNHEGYRYNCEYIYENCKGCKYEDEECTSAQLADYLIANGVTVQKHGRWISVDESLPELIPCNAGTAYSEAVIVWTTGRKVMIAVWDGIDWLCAADFWEAWGDEVTHWMPLPNCPNCGADMRGESDVQNN